MPAAWERLGAYPLSSNERDFIVDALKKELRVDGRRPFEYRKLQIQVALSGNSVTVTLGQTLVEASICGTIEQPAPERPIEGIFRLRVDASSMAAPRLDAAPRAGEDASDVQLMLEKAVRDVHAVDLEALCIAAGRKVWSIQLDIKLLDLAGNAPDAAFVAALAALMAFRRPEVTFDAGTGVLAVHPTSEREALPLNLHHAPLAVSFALFQDGDAALIDPGMKEEAAADGVLTVVLNAQGEVCMLNKAGGLELPFSEIMRLVGIATVKRAELGDALKAALETHEAARVAARVRRKDPTAAGAALPRSVAVLPSLDITEVLPELGVSLGDLEDAVAQATSSDESDLGDGAEEAIEAGARDANGAEPRLPSDTRAGRRPSAHANADVDMDANGDRSGDAAGSDGQAPPDKGSTRAAFGADLGPAGGQPDLREAVKRKKQKRQPAVNAS